MAAARDVVLGVGATAGARRNGAPSAGWVLAGAVADAADAAVLAGAMRSGKARGITAAGVAAGAVISAVAGGWAAAQLARRR
jgi:hypothetical protein